MLEKRKRILAFCFAFMYCYMTFDLELQNFISEMLGPCILGVVVWALLPPFLRLIRDHFLYEKPISEKVKNEIEIVSYAFQCLLLNHIFGALISLIIIKGLTTWSFFKQLNGWKVEAMEYLVVFFVFYGTFLVFIHKLWEKKQALFPSQKSQ